MTDKERLDSTLSEVKAHKEAVLKAEQELHQLKTKTASNRNENYAAEKLAKRKLSAKEAREIADVSTKVLSQIYKIIRDESEEGRTRLDWGTMYLSEQCKNNIVKALEADDYRVTVCDTELIICW